jgi:predicted Zn-dependent protease
MLFIVSFRSSSGPISLDPTDAVSTPVSCEPLSATALQTLERCADDQPGDVGLLIALGQRYESVNRWVDAERSYRRAVSGDPLDAEARFRLGRVLLQLGNTGGALVEGDAALALQPGNPAILDLMERAAAREGRTQGEGARSDMTSASRDGATTR